MVNNQGLGKDQVSLMITTRLNQGLIKWFNQQ